MSKYKVVYKTNNIFELTNSSNFDFEKSKINLTVFDGIIETAEVELDAVDEQEAESKSNNIVMQLNNFWQYLFGFFLVQEPLKIEYMKKPNGLRTVTSSLILKYSIRGKININDLELLYHDNVDNIKFRKLLNFLGDAERTFEWKFLQLYKIIEFEKNADQREKFISEKFEMPRSSRQLSKDKLLRTDLTWKRIDMAHDLCPIISKDNLKRMAVVVKEILQEYARKK